MLHNSITLTHHYQTLISGAYSGFQVRGWGREVRGPLWGSLPVGPSGKAPVRDLGVRPRS